MKMKNLENWRNTTHSACFVFLLKNSAHFVILILEFNVCAQRKVHHLFLLPQDCISIILIPKHCTGLNNKKASIIRLFTMLYKMHHYNILPSALWTSHCCVLLQQCCLQPLFLFFLTFHILDFCKLDKNGPI